MPILIGIFILAACLRLYGLDKQSFWYDEVAEETAFQRQFLDHTIGIVPDTPPLHATFVYIITRLFPRDDLALRIIPCIFGLISIPLMYLLGKQLFTKKEGLIASFLLAVSPYHIWYSQEVRMYALYWMLALISMIYFLRALDNPKKGNFTGYVISTVACFYTIQLAVFLVTVQFLYLLFFLQKYRAQFLKWIGAFSLVIFLYLPWIIYNLSSLMERGASFPKDIDPLIVIPYTFYTYFAGFSVGPSLREYHLNLSLSVIKPYIILIGIQMFLFGSLIIVGVWSIRKDLPRLLLLILITIVPIIGFLILIKVVMTEMTYNVRYTGIAFYGPILIVSSGLVWLNSLKQNKAGRILSIIALIAITGFSSYSYANYLSDKRYSKPDIRGTVAYIREQKAEGDLILCIVDNATFNRYSKDDFSCGEFPHNMDRNRKEEIETALNNLVKEKKRLWLVISQEWYLPMLADYSKTWFDRNYVEIKQLHRDIYNIANVRIYAYDLIGRKP